ncbi:TetR family transcriptional regulator [Corynebacterium poyangense]|uniref:TetR family transcriptional regulator n=1 Tax=Corynebacterium poyangense TaxID=2684405 RepID=A0A7H0SRU0_9CORY|nr:TetR/AcrR family transcriptional regulator [Corynebacterium poyangense]MBZ8176699.1 TetR family transcriptional regulator [Corynebacterium poyangense]QNQ91265.1 TetR family transcriptional regulator [Corynebacterium poyangense]
MARRRDRPSPRHRLLESATRLFTTEGIRVIGIDRILREADVAKASLYSLFGSKDALVAAYVRNLDAQWRESWENRTANLAEPVLKILAFFDQCMEEEPGKNFRGSHFQNAASEFPRPETEAEHDIIAAVQEHRQWCRDTLTRLLSERNGYPSASQAEQLLILLDGGLAGVKLSKSLQPLQVARDLAKDLLSAPPADYSI